jgi:phage host-nuclease inhibitor protein Gam
MKSRGQGASPEQARANYLLGEIQDALLIIKHTEADLQGELARLKAASGVWRTLEEIVEQNRQRLVRADQEIKILMKEHQGDFFAVDGLGSCSLDLPHGALLYDKTDYVVKPRKVDVLAALSRYGFEEAIRRTAAVDWEVLDNKEEWPDEVLAIIGTRREVKETFAYEIKEQGSGVRGQGSEKTGKEA